MSPAFRYFLGFRPDPPLRASLATLQPRAGQREHRVAPPRLHLTLCTIAETTTFDAALVARETFQHRFPTGWSEASKGSLRNSREVTSSRPPT